MTRRERFQITARVALVALAAGGLGGCSPEVGSDAWCKSMDGKSKADWSANDATSYAKHCVIGLKPDKG